MLGLNNKLKRLDDIGKTIKVAIVGAGKMGRSLVNQLSLVKGMVPSLVVNRTREKAVNAYISAGIKKEDIVITNSLKEINKALEEGKPVVTEYADLVPKADLIDIVVDATGVPETGARLAIESISNKKNIVALNVESDAVVGPILHKYAEDAGVVYTGTAGDEPGAVIELYEYAIGIGFDVLAIGKGKNNPINLDANPETVCEKAKSKKLKPKMLASFIDGTNTMIEMTCMANATGFIPDVRGGHGVNGVVEELPDIFRLKKDGGLLNKYGVVDYVNGIAPGVFVIITTKNDEVHNLMRFLKMGSGPNYILYRPYHLTSLETPATIARAVLYEEPTIAPTKGMVAETVTLAKKDLKAGDKLDYIGGYTVYGKIETYENAKKNNLIPIGLINENAIVKKDIKKGELLTYDSVNIDTSTLIYKLRILQDELMI